MSETECNIKCAHEGCETKFSKNVYTSGVPGDKFGNIHHALLMTRLFCMNHCYKHAYLICKNSKIVIKDED